MDGRNDLSRSVIHLTRDDRGDAEDGVHGQRAEANFRGIIDSRQILALKPHCLHGDLIPEAHRERFAVCCVTEVPLSELHLLTRPIDGRRIELSEYGIAFTREFLMSRGGAARGLHQRLSGQHVSQGGGRHDLRHRGGEGLP